MEEVEICISSDSSDVVREEEGWSSKHEDFLGDMKTNLLTSSTCHKAASAKNTSLYVYLTLPVVIFPIVATFLNEYSSGIAYVPQGFTVTASVIAALNAFFNFGKRSADHGHAAGAYNDLAENIAYTLARKKRARPPCDVTLTKYIHQHQTLTASAPAL